MSDENSINNNYGQVYMLNCLKTVTSTTHPVVAFDETLDSLITRLHELDVSNDESYYSSFYNCRFVNNIGLQVSSIFVDTSYL